MISIVAALLLCSFLPRTSSAEPADRRKSPYRFNVAIELPLALASLAVNTVGFVKPQPASCLPQCDGPTQNPGFDDRVLGNYSAALRPTTDVLVGALMIAPHAVNVIAQRGRGTAWIEDAAVSIEALLLAQSLVQMMKSAADRYAPLVYDEQVPLDERSTTDATRSFPSGHTANAVAAATSFSVSYWLRNPRDPWRLVLLAALESTAISVGLMTIRGGYHYPSDVLVGGLLGASVGVLVPMLHVHL